MKYLNGLKVVFVVAALCGGQVVSLPSVHAGLKGVAVSVVAGFLAGDLAASRLSEVCQRQLTAPFVIHYSDAPSRTLDRLTVRGCADDFESTAKAIQGLRDEAVKRGTSVALKE